MKKKHLFKKLIPAIFLLAASKCFSEIQIIPNIGFSFSTMGEYLYSPYSTNLWSYLKWEEKPSVNFGFNSAFKFKSNSFKFNFFWSLPLKCGNMTDSDWSESGINYAYSVNENSIKCSFLLETEYSRDFNLKTFLSISPVLGAKFLYSSYKARNGYGWYGSEEWSKNGELVSWKDENAHYFPDEKYKLAGIDYSRCTLMLKAGLSASFKLRKTEITASFFCSPFTYIYAADHHLGKTNDFKYEEIQYPVFKYYETTLEVSYKINRLLMAYSKAGYTFGLKSKGESYKNSSSKSYQKSGSDYSSANLCAGLGFFF